MTGLPRPDLNWPHACVFQPIARLSAESYKERKANNGQTLTRLGKWWGRKPLVLVRAAILGMLMPASADARRDREVFLQLLTMDDDGSLAALQSWRLDRGPIPALPPRPAGRTSAGR